MDIGEPLSLLPVKERKTSHIRTHERKKTGNSECPRAHGRLYWPPNASASRLPLYFDKVFHGIGSRGQPRRSALVLSVLVVKEQCPLGPPPRVVRGWRTCTLTVNSTVRLKWRGAVAVGQDTAALSPLAKVGPYNQDTIQVVGGPFVPSSDLSWCAVVRLLFVQTPH